MSEASEFDEQKIRVVFVTVPDVDAGVILARRIVSERLAACGNVIPGLTSVYRWKGEVQEDPEALVILKTTQGAIPALMERVSELHSYEVPEFLVLPVETGFEPYLRWVAGEIGSGGKAP